MTRLRLSIAVPGCWALASAGLAACPVCYQFEPGPVTDGTIAAVVVLVAVTTGVLSGFAVFIGRVVRRSR
jgi:hypothetical protein